MNADIIIGRMEKKLAALEADERIDYPSAEVETNAPLALIQVSLRSQANVIRELLGMEYRAYGKAG